LDKWRIIKDAFVAFAWLVQCWQSSE